ncbi:TSPAN33 [Bugula neritina]|uniref:Tetraspanin n=1 Tax=Bugula neritina TaxID=10212 RepID=A0A7J7JZL7_BUGNE|nr:TSPAN33 [Bugula neritina]
MGCCERENREISPAIKWILFTFNIVFWVISVLIIAVGIWGYVLTKELNTNNGTAAQKKDIFDILFDITIVIMAFGSLVFMITFFGAIGALRENICLLRTYAVFLGIVFLVEISLAVVILSSPQKVKSGLRDVLHMEAIEDYRDADINRRNVIDWFQETFECCGIGEDGYKSWENNRYFSCSGPGFEACSVPHSCCREEFRVLTTRCGEGMLNPTLTRAEASQTIYTVGCVDAAFQYARDNTLLLGGISLVVVIPQVLGVALAISLSRQISRHRKLR